MSMVNLYTIFTPLEARGGGLLFIKINLQTRLLIVTRLVNEANIVNKTRTSIHIITGDDQACKQDQASISTWS